MTEPLAVPAPVTVTVDVAEPDPADEAVLALLPAAEAQRAARFRRPADRARFLTAQALLRRVVARELGVGAVELDRRCPGCGSTVHGPLAVTGPDAARVSVSSSHSGGRVVVAAVVVAAGTAPSVGVDVEEVGAREGTLSVAPTVLTAGELAGHRAAADPHADLITRWSRKEAVLKATRQGLTVPMVDVAVSEPAAAPAVLDWTGTHRPAGVGPSTIALADVDAGPGHRAAVAVLTDRPLRVVVRDGRA
ncbi:4'-phosphopantetheinyl transferase superfamily protein [Rhodococcus aerolatus]